MLNIPNDFEIDGYGGLMFMTRICKPYTNANANRIIGDIVKAHNEEEARKAIEEKREPVLLLSFSAYSLRHTFCTNFAKERPTLNQFRQL